MRAKVAVVGLGDIGLGLCRILLDDSSASLVGAVDTGEGYKSHISSRARIGDVLGESRAGPEITDDIEKVYREDNPNILVLATSSNLDSIKDSIDLAIKNKVHVVSPAEQLFFPEYFDPDEAARIDEAARKAYVSVIGRGVNPGLVTDLFPAHFAGQYHPDNIASIVVHRHDNTLQRRHALLKKTGCWLSPEEFSEKNKMALEGKPGFGHVGLEMSAAYMADALELEDYTMRFSRNPVIASEDIKPDDGDMIKKGQVCGLDEHCRIFDNNADPEYDNIPRIMIHLRMNAEQLNSNGVKVGLKDGLIKEHDYSNIINGDQATVRILHDLVFQVMYSEPGLNRMDYVPDPAMLLKQ
ncbi:hypothetical protein GF345_00640 [Candidatus Woesearchaeota archaeon]|nr:hypothetical protein [Candidatus Woesearchaeota archaeon]